MKIKNSDMDRVKKKEELLGKKKGTKVIGLALIISVAVLTGFWLAFRNGEAGLKELSGSRVMDNISYKNQNVAMSPVEAVIAGGMLEVPLDAVKENKLISYSYVNKGNRIPLMAYVAPSGKLVTAVSMCEPCRSTKFHIEGGDMVCNACGTRWDLENLQGISGGCLKYPPDVIGYTIRGDKIMIKETDIKNWKPRV